MPGLLVLLAMFGSLFTGFGLIAELRAGVIERSRVTPVSRLALLIGRSLRDVVSLLFQAALIVIVAVGFGLNVDVLNVLAAFALMAVISLMLSAFSYAISLKAAQRGRPRAAAQHDLPAAAADRGHPAAAHVRTRLAQERRRVEPVLLGHRRRPGPVRRQPRRRLRLAGGRRHRRPDPGHRHLGLPSLRPRRPLRQGPLRQRPPTFCAARSVAWGCGWEPPLLLRPKAAEVKNSKEQPLPVTTVTVTAPSNAGGAVTPSRRAATRP